ncbi:MAG: DNA/RNA non-specific endonuclease [Pyrinomonadaceae bacterium]
MRKIVFIFVYLFSFTIAITAQLVLGNPSGASSNLDKQNNYLVGRQEFILAYNRSRGTANWVAWHLSSSDLGPIRIDAFHGDPLLPKPWRIGSAGYKGSGYQRGHMCPSKDRSTTEAINRITFVMSNMQPQLKELNEDTWGNLEDETRRLINQGNEAYIYAGCFGNKGRIKKKVTIPTHCFKVVVILPEGSNDLKRITKDTSIIAVIMPNIRTINKNWRTYITTVDAIESRTGFDFLSPIPNVLEKSLEKKKYAD